VLREQRDQVVGFVVVAFVDVAGTYVGLLFAQPS
jgi:hypothetical protein